MKTLIHWLIGLVCLQGGAFAVGLPAACAADLNWI
jgi:hypothetical protein